MRISDWSSDVCPSDLKDRNMNQPLQFSEIGIERALDCAAAECGMVPTPSQHLAAKQVLTSTITKISGIAGTGRTQTFRSEERRVGKDVSVRVDLGGRRIIKKKTKDKKK